MLQILYRGWPLALGEPDRVHLHPELEALAERDESHPLVRFACALALHAFEPHADLSEGRFDQARAERYARELSMPAEAFGGLVWLTDAELAALFGVPVEQVSARRLDLPRDRPVSGLRIDIRLARARGREKRIENRTLREEHLCPIEPSCWSQSGTDSRRDNLMDQPSADTFAAELAGCREGWSRPERSAVRTTCAGRGSGSWTGPQATVGQGQQRGATLNVAGSLIGRRGEQRAA